MFENIAALDIGTHTIKLVIVRTGFRDFQLKTLVYETIDQHLDNPAEALKEALTRLLKEENIRGYRIITNLPMEKEIIRNISFPFSDVEKIAEAIPFEAEENIPFKLDDLILDFQSLKSIKEGEGRVLLAAAHKDTLYDFIGFLGEQTIHPLKMGMEANGLFECYRYFNKIEEEAVIQLDIGNSKTIINIIENKTLLYTRSISFGIEDMHEAVADILKIPYGEAVSFFENLNLDLISFDNNIQKEHFKSMGVNKQKLKKIFISANEILHDLIEQIFLTIKAFYIDYGKLSFSRALISGGGANITGVGTILSRELEIPVVSLPFVEGYTDEKIKTAFPIAFGTLLTFLNQKRYSINFLKGEFLPDIASATRKIYYLAGGFVILTVFVLIIKLFIAVIITAKSNDRYNDILTNNFKTYFGGANLTNDPINDAKKILKKKKKDYESISTIASDDASALEVIRQIMNFWEKEPSLDVKNMTVNERVVRIDGNVTTSKVIDSFKERLIQSKLFDTVNLQIRYSGKTGDTPFSLTIKLKTTDTVTTPRSQP